MIKDYEKLTREGEERLNKFNGVKPNEIIETLLNDVSVRSCRFFESYIKDILNIDNKPKVKVISDNSFDKDNLTIDSIEISFYNTIGIDIRGIYFKPEHGSMEYIIDYFA